MAEVLRQGMMTKRGTGRRGGMKTWKERFFVLTKTELSYWDKDGGPKSGAQKKGEIAINTIAVVEEVADRSFDRNYLFQVVSGKPPLPLYIQCRDPSERAAWLKVLRGLIATSSSRDMTFHPGYFDGKAYTCCGASTTEAGGCKATTIIDSDEYVCRDEGVMMRG